MDSQTQKTQRISLKTVLKEKELWLLVLLGILYFYRPLFMGETFYERDLYLHFFLRKQLLVDFINSRELPLWNPYLHGGQAYIAELSNSVLYPSNLLFLFLPLINAFNLNIIVHFLGCSAFTYLLSRTIGLCPVSSFIAGIIYGFCGYTLSLGNFLGLLMAMPYVPLLLLFWHLYLVERKRKWFVLTVVAGVFQVFAGAPETNIMSLLFLLGWTLFWPYPHQSFRRRGARWLLLAACIIGIASIQIFPTVEMILHSSRGQGLDFASIIGWSLYPERLPELLFPGFLGYQISADIPKEAYWWGTKLFDEPRPYIFSIYFGGMTMFLALWGGLRKGDGMNVPFRARIFLLSSFALALGLSLGRFLPFFSMSYEFIPLLKLFRFPIKFLIAGILPFALLAGYASGIHFGNSGTYSQRIKHNTVSEHDSIVTHYPSLNILRVLWGIFAILLMFITVFMLSDDFANVFQEFFFKQSGSKLIRRGLEMSFFHAIAIWLSGTLLYQYRRFKKRHWQHWILACILMLDVFVAGKQVNSYAPKEFFTIEPEIVQIIRQEIGDGRLYRYPKNLMEDNPNIALQVIRRESGNEQRYRSSQNSKGDSSKIILRVPSKDVMWLYRWSLEVLNYYLAALYRIPVIYHQDFTELAQARVINLQSIIESFPWEKRLPLLSAGGVTLILTSEDISIPGIQRIQQLPNRSNIPLYLYRNERAAKRIEFITDWKLVTSDNEATEAMLHPDYDPRKYVVIQQPESTFFSPNLSENAQNNRHINAMPQPCRSLQFKLNKESSNTHSASFLVSNSCDGYLVFSDAYYPGWRVSVDGKRTPILKANNLFSAVFLKAGKHKVEKFYRPNSLIIGALSSLVFCCIVSFIAYKGKFLSCE